MNMIYVGIAQLNCFCHTTYNVSTISEKQGMNISVTRLRLVIYELSCSTCNIPRGLSANKP